MLAVLILLLFSVSNAQDINPTDLNKQIAKMDYLLFDNAFNQCDIELYKKIVSPQLEFYDDRTGLNISFEKELAAFNDRCSKSHTVTRKLVDHNVYRLGEYGAVQIGEHNFYVDGKKVENAKFIIIWEKTEGSWVMKRTISYEHKPILDKN